MPIEVAQNVFDEMVNAGVQAVLSFAPTQLKDHPEVRVTNVDVKINLELPSFYLVQAEQTR